MVRRWKKQPSQSDIGSVSWPPPIVTDFLVCFICFLFQLNLLVYQNTQLIALLLTLSLLSTAQQPQIILFIILVLSAFLQMSSSQLDFWEITHSWLDKPFDLIFCCWCLPLIGDMSDLCLTGCRLYGYHYRMKHKMEALEGQARGGGRRPRVPFASADQR